MEYNTANNLKLKFGQEYSETMIKTLHLGAHKAGRYLTTQNLKDLAQDISTLMKFIVVWLKWKNSKSL